MNPDLERYMVSVAELRERLLWLLAEARWWADQLWEAACAADDDELTASLDPYCQVLYSPWALSEQNMPTRIQPKRLPWDAP